MASSGAQDLRIVSDSIWCMEARGSVLGCVGLVCGDFVREEEDDHMLV